MATKLNNLELVSAEDSLEIERLSGELAKLEAIEGDATRSLKERNEAIIAGAKKQSEIAKLQEAEAKRKLEIFDLENNFAQQGLEFTSKLKIARIALEKDVLAAENASLEKKIAIGTKKNQIDQDVSELELDILIDGFDKRKSLNEKIIDDETKNFVKRKELLKRTKILADKSLEAQVEVLNKTAIKKINIEALVAEKSAINLKNEILGYELSEILTTRLIEVVKERQQVEADLAEKTKALNDERIANLKETIQNEEDLTTSVIENENEKSRVIAQAVFDRAENELNTKIKRAEGDVELTKKLNAEKLALQKQFKEKNDDIDIKTLETKLKKEASLKEIALIKSGKTEKQIQEELRDLRIAQLTEEIALRESLDEKALDKKLELARLQAKKEVDIAKEREKELVKVKALASDTFFRIQQENLDKELAGLNKKTDETQNQIKRQEDLAKNGLANTLAFEQAELAKLEVKKLELAKRQIRNEKIKALYSGYVANTNAGDTSAEALSKALRDYGIVTGLELALRSAGTGTGAGNFDDFFKSGENGSKGGNSLNNGIFRGDSHKAKSGGIPLLVERNEALLDSPRMNKFGQQNWNKLIHGIDSGKIGSDFMNEQIRAIPVAGGVNINFAGLENSINEVKKSIENKPVQNVDVENMSDLYADFIDKKTQGNKVEVSRYRVRKKRF